MMRPHACRRPAPCTGVQGVRTRAVGGP